jgi:SAM-dependent methyltransferase
MIMTMRGWIDDALRQAKESAFDLQPWPDYFEFKAEELKTILDYYEFSDADSILEIGCGNGFTSYLLSKKAGRVEALDLPDMDPSSHSIGIFTAEKLAENMRVDNMGVAGGSVMDMPYKSGSFDVVFSQYMLQYVRDKRKALSEMRRVLADDGVMVTIVPNFTERILVPIIKCEYVAGRLLAHLRSCAERPRLRPAHRLPGGQWKRMPLLERLAIISYYGRTVLTGRIYRR